VDQDRDTWSIGGVEKRPKLTLDRVYALISSTTTTTTTTTTTIIIIIPKNTF